MFPLINQYTNYYFFYHTLSIFALLIVIKPIKEMIFLFLLEAILPKRLIKYMVSLKLLSGKKLLFFYKNM